MLYQFVVVDYLVRRIGVTSPVNLYHKHPHLEKRLAPFSFIVNKNLRVRGPQTQQYRHSAR